MNKTNFPSVAALIRVWSKDAGNAMASVRRAIANGVGLVVVVVKDEDPEFHGAVSRALKELIDPNHPNRIQVVEMREGYGWSNALNAGFARIRLVNQDIPLNSGREITHVLSVSNEVEWTRSHLDDMLFMARDGMIHYEVVGMDLTGVYPEGHRTSLGRTYKLPRNTCMLISLRAYEEVGHFDPICDGFGGMEDVHFLIWMELLACGHFIQSALSAVVGVGVHYDQMEKEERELAAIRKIIVHIRLVVGDDPGRRMCLDRALHALGIADLA